VSAVARYTAFDRFADEACIVGDADFTDDVAVEKDLTVCGSLSVDGEMSVGDRPVLPPMWGAGPPGPAQALGRGQLYVDSSAGRVYLCTDPENGGVWKELVLK
jgi:outer membrane protein assembly factor BamB